MVLLSCGNYSIEATNAPILRNEKGTRFRVGGTFYYNSGFWMKGDYSEWGAYFIFDSQTTVTYNMPGYSATVTTSFLDENSGCYVTGVESGTPDLPTVPTMYYDIPLFRDADISKVFTPYITHKVPCGGGATHIAKVSNLLKDIYDPDDLYIVAGGGGGAMIRSSATYPGDDAGGISGNGNKSASQSSGYARGQGQSVDITNRNVLSAGGGGYYGGYRGTTGTAGGGGSGYIGNTLLIEKKMVGYNVPTSSDESTKTETSSTSSSSPTSNQPKEGNGYAKITFLRSYDYNRTIRSGSFKQWNILKNEYWNVNASSETPIYDKGSGSSSDLTKMDISSSSSNPTVLFDNANGFKITVYKTTYVFSTPETILTIKLYYNGSLFQTTQTITVEYFDEVGLAFGIDWANNGLVYACVKRKSNNKYGVIQINQSATAYQAILASST